MTWLLECTALPLVLVALALFILLDEPEDLGRVTEGWRRRHRDERER